MIVYLLIDVGNTAIKWSISTPAGLRRMCSYIYSIEGLPNQLNQQITQRYKQTPKAVIISNVAGPMVEKILITWTLENYQLSPVFPRVSKNFHGLVNAYDNPSLLGVDRWMAIIAANDRIKEPICIVDCGTAVTIDAVNEEQQFIGGVILPGLRIMQRSLNLNTNALPKIGDTEVGDVFAKNTKQGIKAGTTFAIVSMIELMCTKLNNLSQKQVTCVLTGGDAKLIEACLSFPKELVPDLVIQGLYLWGKENELD